MALIRLLLAATLLACTSAVEVARPQSIGDVLEWRAPKKSGYLKKQQVVGVISPNSGGRRTVNKKDGTFEGVSRRRVHRRPPGPPVTSTRAAGSFRRAPPGRLRHTGRASSGGFATSR